MSNKFTVLIAISLMTLWLFGCSGDKNTYLITDPSGSPLVTGETPSSPLATGQTPSSPPGTAPTASLQWTYVDGGTKAVGMSGTVLDVTEPNLVSYNGKLYAAWAEGSTVRVVVYNGNDTAPGWSAVDAGAISTGALSSMSPQLVEFSAKLYIIWLWKDGANQTQVRVAVYNGDDAAPGWSFVEGSGTTGTSSGISGPDGVWGPAAQLTVFGSKLYATWADGAAVHVAVYNGDDNAPAWSSVDTGGLKTSNTGAYHPMLAVLGSRLYLVFRTDMGIQVSVYNGNDGFPAWTSVTGPGGEIWRIYPGQSYNARLVVFNDKLYLSWSENLNVNNNLTRQVRVAVYNGDDANPDWSFLDSNGPFGINNDPHQYADGNPRLAVFGNRLYAVWSECLPDVEISQVRIAVYNGDDANPAWTFVDKGQVGLNYDRDRDAYGPNLAVFNSKIYVAWAEYTLNGYSIRMAVGQ